MNPDPILGMVAEDKKDKRDYKSMATIGGIMDPLNLFNWKGDIEGMQAEDAADFQKQAALEAQQRLQARQDKIDSFFKPYAEAGKEAIPYITGSKAIEPDAMFANNLKLKGRALKWQQLGKGRLRSTDTARKATALVGSEVQDLITRRWNQLIDLGKMGSGAVAEMGRAGRNTINQVSSVYNNASSNAESIINSSMNRNIANANQTASTGAGIASMLSNFSF